MNKAIPTRLAALVPTLLLAMQALAGEPAQHEEHTIKIKTSGAEVFEADLTELAVGESRAFVTESGKAIDLIRTADGAEVYIDGELVDIGSAGLHEAHVAGHREVTVECLAEGDGAAECDHDVMFVGNADIADGEIEVIRKHVEIVCDAGEDCEDMVWVEADGDFDYGYQALEDAAGDAHKVVVIRKHHTETVTEE